MLRKNWRQIETEISQDIEAIVERWREIEAKGDPAARLPFLFVLRIAATGKIPKVDDPILARHFQRTNLGE